jgi:SWIM zinc finger
MTAPLTKDKIEQLAPDQASLGAALKLMKSTGLPILGRNDDSALLWGECQGSGAAPYRVIVSPTDVGYKCTCPSRKFPCKHVLAVMWMHCEKPERFEQGSTPDWVEDWLSRRRRKASTAAPDLAADRQNKPATSIRAALAEAEEEETPSDPKAIARAEAQRQRLRDEREASVRAGLDDVDRWILDQLNLGLAGFAQRAAQSTKPLSARLVDAKAQGLASRLEALAADIYRVPEQMRADLAFERLAALSLISSAYRHQTKLPPSLQADVRRVTSWALRREELLADPQAPRLAGDWIVAATRSEVQPDKLRRLETWLLHAAPPKDAPAVALLIDFVPVSGGPASSPFFAGETLCAEVVFYPSATPLRALIATRTPASAQTINWPGFPPGLGAALAEYETALARQPWIEYWPLRASALTVDRLSAQQLALADSEGYMVPIERLQTDILTTLLGLGPISALFIWDGTSATLLAADTSIGRWHET